jgi:class 3 adenylate cyclase
MAPWRQRAEAVLARATFHYSQTDSPQDEDLLDQLAGRFSQGLAILRAQSLETDVCVLTVAGSTLCQVAQAAGRPPRLLDFSGLPARSVSSASVAPAGPPLAAEQRQEIKAILFADMADFSRLHEERTPAFFARYFGAIEEALREAPGAVDFTTTWGDGVLMFFGDVVACARVALSLRDRMAGIDWQEVGLSAHSGLRIGLHVGTVYPIHDPIIGRLAFMGQQVTRAARIEPVTPPGCVYTSEQFAALLAAVPGHDFLCECVGNMPLAKHYDQVPLYHLIQRER